MLQRLKRFVSQLRQWFASSAFDNDLERLFSDLENESNHFVAEQIRRFEKSWRATEQ